MTRESIGRVKASLDRIIIINILGSTMTNITTEHREALGPLVEFLDDTYADPDFDMPITLNKADLPSPHNAGVAFLREIAADRPWTMGFRVGSAGEIILVFTPQSGLVADLEAALAQDFDLLSDVVAGTA